MAGANVKSNNFIEGIMSFKTPSRNALTVNCFSFSCEK